MISLDACRSQWLGNIRGDLLAGLVVALALIPEAIAFSIIAGVDPKVGLWGAIYAVSTTSSAVVMIWAGSLTDRIRVRHFGLGVLIGLALAAASMAWIGEVWMLVVVIFLLRLSAQGLMGHTAMAAMARWFVATRGRAVSVAGLGVATGEALLPIAFVALLGAFDWRMPWLVAAGTLLALTPPLWSLLRHERTPQSFAQASGGAGMQNRMWTRAEALRHPVFWRMVPALLGPAAWNTAFFFQQVHLSEIKGWAHVTPVSLFPLFTATSVAFMLVAGGLVDRFGSHRLAAAYLLPIAAGFLVLALAQSVAAAALGIVLMGAGVGLHATMMGTFWPKVFGTRHLGAIRAMMGAIMVPGTAIGPAITGVLIDRGLDFGLQSCVIAFCFLAAGLLAGAAGRRVRTLQGLPARVSS